PLPPPPSAANLGYPPGYPAPAAGNNLGYPPAYGYPMQSGLPVPAMPSPSDAALAVEATEDDDAVVLAAAEPGEVFHPPALTHIEPAKPANALVRAWRKIGGGSLTLSLAIHAGILLFAGAIVVSTQMIQKQVDFLPGGGTQQGAEASAEMRHKVNQKRRTSLNKTMPMKKIVSTSQNAAISLPEAPPDMLDVPDVSSMIGGGSLGSGGFGKAGSGGGFGTGMGMGG